jgi:predicted amidohydrolase
VPGRDTYGHSLVVSPWGEMVADGGEEPGIVMAQIDTEAVAKARTAIPSLTHDRPFAPPVPVGWTESAPEGARLAN